MIKNRPHQETGSKISFNLLQHLQHHLRPDPEPINKFLTVVNANKIDLRALILIKQLSYLRISRKQLSFGRCELVHDFLVFLAAVLVGADGKQIAIVHFFNDIHLKFSLKFIVEMSRVFAHRCPLFVHQSYDNLAKRINVSTNYVT